MFQVSHVLVPRKPDNSPHWERCVMNIQSCTQDQMKTLNGMYQIILLMSYSVSTFCLMVLHLLTGFRETLISTLSDFQHRKGSGLYIDSCYKHCQATSDLWHALKLSNKVFKFVLIFKMV